MSEFDFQGNSAEMFEALTKGAPLPMRGMVKKALVKALAEIAGGEGAAVQPAMLVEATKKSTPKPFVAGALKSVKDMYKCETACDGCSAGCPLAP